MLTIDQEKLNEVFEKIKHNYKPANIFDTFKTYISESFPNMFGFNDPANDNESGKDIDYENIEEHFVEIFEKEGIDSSTAKTLAHNLNKILQIYVEDKQLNDPDYNLNENDIGEFIKTKLKDGSLIKIEVASAAVTDMDGIIYLSKFAIMRNAALTCASNSICLAGLAVASIGYIGYILYKDNLEDDKVFNTASTRGSLSAGGSPEDPDDWDDWKKDKDEDQNLDNFKWNVKESNDADKITRHERFGKFYRDPEQTIDGKRIWWSKDRGGDRAHSGEHFKMFKEYNKELRWVADVDKNGKIIPKHKSDIGKSINKKDLIGIK